MVKKAFSREALLLMEMDGKEFASPINANIVKKYYAWDGEIREKKGLNWKLKKAASILKICVFINPMNPTTQPISPQPNMKKVTRMVKNEFIVLFMCNSRILGWVVSCGSCNLYNPTWKINN